MKTLRTYLCILIACFFLFELSSCERLPSIRKWGSLEGDYAGECYEYNDSTELRRWADTIYVWTLDWERGRLASRHEVLEYRTEYDHQEGQRKNKVDIVFESDIERYEPKLLTFSSGGNLVNFETAVRGRFENAESIINCDCSRISD